MNLPLIRDDLNNKKVIGNVKVTVYPTDPLGQKNLSEEYDEVGEIEPSELLGQRIDIIIQIDSAELQEDRCEDSYI